MSEDGIKIAKEVLKKIYDSEIGTSRMVVCSFLIVGLIFDAYSYILYSIFVLIIYLKYRIDRRKKFRDDLVKIESNDKEYKETL